MGRGILVCGLNGCGKSTLGRALAERMKARFIDNEDLFFPKTDPRYAFSAPRSRKEAEELLWEEVQAHERFVFAAVRGDYGERVLPLYELAVLLEVPREQRLQRVRERSFHRFGSRMLKGGDLYEQEEGFFRLVESRPEDYVETWARSLSCPVLRLDGRAPVEENISVILEKLK